MRCLGRMMIVLFGFVVSSYAQPALDVKAFLENNGYSADAFALQMSWSERAPNTGAWVTGLHVLPLDGGRAFDLYADEQGALLEEDTVRTLGIPAKDWAPRAITQPSETPAAYAKSAALPAAPAPVGQVQQEYALAPIDADRVANEDAEREATLGKGTVRIGVFQDWPAPVTVQGMSASEGAWQTLSDGSRVWTLAIRSMGALGQRVHFAQIALPEGARLIVYNPDDPAESYGPFNAQPDVWAPTCSGEVVAVECQVPAQAAIDRLALTIDRTTHQYQPIAYLAKTVVGSCNLDVSCYSAWATTALGVGGVGDVTDVGSLFCTGSLLADSDTSTTIPYVLTANHCVGTQAEANSVEMYWLYQTSSCKGAAPSLMSVPRTTGKPTLLATSIAATGTDFALLRLSSQPPAGLTWLGFSTNAASVGSLIAVIHHPEGDYKRISFGRITDSGSPSSSGERLQPIARFHEAVYSQGTTEPGSSGSPLFLQGLQVIIGQLWGGEASCSLPLEPDYYGRFDVTYPLVKKWLGATNGQYDLDQSGKTDATDLELAMAAALYRSGAPNADVDSSGDVNAVDVQLVAIAAANGQ